MTEEFNLSEKAKEWFCARAELDVQEFINILKEKQLLKNRNAKIIDKYAGERFK